MDMRWKTELSHHILVREGCSLGSSHQGKTIQKTWPSTLDAHLALAAGPLTIRRLVSNLTALAHCPFTTVKFSASLSPILWRSASEETVSKAATFSSQHLGCTCTTYIHTCPSFKMYLQWFPAHTSYISDYPSSDSQLANFHFLSQIEEMPISLALCFVLSTSLFRKSWHLYADDAEISLSPQLQLCLL